MDNFQEQIFEMIGRIRQNGLNQSKSKAAAAIIEKPCQYMVANNTDRDKTGGSKAASYQTVVTKYEMGGSSSSDNIVYQCGTHNFETRNLKEFNEHVSRLPHNDNSSKAASVCSVNKSKAIYDFVTSNGNI